MSTITYPEKVVSVDVVTELPPSLINGGGITGVLVWLLWMLGTGRLITRQAHLEMRADKDELIATQAETVKEQREQLGHLTAVSDMSVRILESVEGLANDRRGA